MLKTDYNIFNKIIYLTPIIRVIFKILIIIYVII
jgi:hypothetical protein